MQGIATDNPSSNGCVASGVLNCNGVSNAKVECWLQDISLRDCKNNLKQQEKLTLEPYIVSSPNGTNVLIEDSAMGHMNGMTGNQRTWDKCARLIFFNDFFYFDINKYGVYEEGMYGCM